MSAAYLRNQALPFRLRTEKVSSLARLKSQISNRIRSVLNENEFIQIYPPIITEHDCEGGGEAFRIEASKPDFFSKPAYLSVSTQLHLEMAAASLQRVYSFSPVFRAENQQTTKHLSEFWMLECEMAFLSDFNALLGTIEQLIRSCCEGMVPIHRISYTDAVKELLSAKNVQFDNPVYWGADLKTEQEKFLAEVVFNGPVFVTDYPSEVKPFYMKLNSDGRTVACCDLLVPGVGEVVGASLREDDYDVLKTSMEQKLGLKHNLDWYLDLRKFGGTQHGGFGIGFDRLIQYISGTSNIRDTVMIPRFCGSIKY
jgi:asparaginyl-tRNA synthetase